MAKDLEKKIDKAKEKEKREKDRKAKEEKEKKELALKRKEKQKKQKLRDERRKKREMLERRRIMKIVNFPFKALMQGSLLAAVITFIILYVNSEFDLLPSAFNSFLVFATLYIGIGIIMIAVFFTISEIKKKELSDKLKEEENRRMEEQRQKAEELAKLEGKRRKDEIQRVEEIKRFREQQQRAEFKQPPTGKMIQQQVDEIMIEKEMSNMADMVDMDNVPEEITEVGFEEFNPQFDLEDFTESENIDNLDNM